MPIARDGGFIGSVPLAFERLAEYLAEKSLVKLVERVQKDGDTEQSFHPNDVVYAGVNMMALLQRETRYDFASLARKASRGQQTGLIPIGQRIATFVEIALTKDQRKLLAAIDQIPIEDHGPSVFAVVSLLQQYQREKGRDLSSAARKIRESMKGKEGAAAIDLRGEKFLS